MKIRAHSVKRRLTLLLLVCFLPITVAMVSILYMVGNFSNRYNSIVQNIAAANQYNLTFKEELDYTMYIVIVNTNRAAELVDPEKPLTMIEGARSTFQKLIDQESEVETRRQMDGIVHNLDTLEERVKEIEADAMIVGMYDKNMYRLDMDIRILTELIQEQIQEYISGEVQRLDVLNESLHRDTVRMVEVNIILLGVVLTIALILSSRIRNIITDGITRLRDVARRAGEGDFTVRAELKYEDEELHDLADGFDQMVEQLENFVEDIKVEQRNLRLTEQRLLQAQINPHFLYNTLNAIMWFAESGEKSQVITIVTALSDFFRTTLSKGRDYITVQEETSHINSYLMIQKLRYDDSLQYTMEIPEELYHYQIVKLTLQPLVENSILHGFKNKRGMCSIAVKGWKDGRDLCFSVEDNGNGMTAERLQVVRQEMNKETRDETEVTSFGLYNVQQRIHLYYGAPYQLSIDSEVGVGTRVELRIPAQEVPSESQAG